MGKPLFAIFLLTCCVSAWGRVTDTDQPGPEEWLADAQSLIGEDRFAEAESMLQKAVATEPGNPELAFWLGFSQARQEKWESARERFLLVIELSPEHERVYTELAGVEFKLGDNQAAISNLRRALQLDPDTDYVKQFLATVLYLEGRKLEALHYWNSIGEPVIETISYQVSTGTSPDLVLRLFPLNEGEKLRREQVLEIYWAQRRLRLGREFGWFLNPGSRNRWDLEIALAPDSPLSSLEMALLENAVRAPLYREVTFRYPWDLGSGRRVAGTFRWDEPRKRLRVGTWFPFVSGESDRFGLSLDVRDEEWKERSTERLFAFETQQVLAEYEYILGGRKALSFHGGYQHQDLGYEVEGSPVPTDPHFALLGAGWTQLFGLSKSDDLSMEVQARSRWFSGSGRERSRAALVAATGALRWRFQPRSSSELRLSLGGGSAGRSLPLDHYFLMGVGQDDPLLLRAHPTVDRGRKGNSPMGRRYFLTNLELHRRLFGWTVLQVGGLLFSDTAVVAGSPTGEEGREWYQDVGFGLVLDSFGESRIEVLFGFDVKSSDFNLWVGVPLVRW